jgi:lysophospholipid acyltransferase
VARTKYYCAWKLSESACIACGLGFNPSSLNRWDRLQNINIMAVEFSENSRAFMENWNINTATWLKENIYLRLLSKRIPKLRATILTALTSAFWHGLYPGYYLTFFGGAVITHIARLARTRLRPFFLKNGPLVRFKIVYDLLGYIVTQVIINYVICPFILHSVTESHNLYMSVYYLGHIFMLIAVLGLPMIPPQRHVKDHTD